MSRASCDGFVDCAIPKSGVYSLVSLCPPKFFEDSVLTDGKVLFSHVVAEFPGSMSFGIIESFPNAFRNFAFFQHTFTLIVQLPMSHAAFTSTCNERQRTAILQYASRTIYLFAVTGPLWKSVVVVVVC